MSHNIEYTRKYRATHLEQERARSREWNRNNRPKVYALNKAYRIRKRREVIDAYGGKCACCSESMFEFLSIDHVDGKGNEHRKSIGGNVYLIPWLIKNNFPKGFQVLCHNCNQAKGAYGVCPHERKRNGG